MLDIRRESGRPVSTIDTTRGQLHPVEVRSTLSPGGRRESASRIYSAVGPTSGDTDETTLAYSYGQDGALARIDSAGVIGPGEISVTTDPATGWTYSTSAPGMRAVYQYDSAGRISDRSTTLGTGPGVLTISSPTSYDAAGNVTTQGAWAYDYDKLGRLVRAEDSLTGEVFQYRYDAASNRTEVKRNGDVTQTLSFGAANEIDTATHPEYAYDELGRLISDTTAGGDRRHYIWDGASRLIGIDLYEPETGHFTNLRMSYDAAGRLVQRDTYLDLTYLAERLTYHYDGDRLIAELDGTGVLREYLYAGGEAPAAMRARQSDGSYQNFFFVTNTHGDVVAVTDRDGNIVNRYAYGPWGEATKLAEEVHQPFRYAGYRYEDGFDLYYLRARWYDAGTGRFLSRDPVSGSKASLVSLNRYAYGACRPASTTDRTGLSPRGPNTSPEWERVAFRQIPPNRAAEANCRRYDTNAGQGMGVDQWWRRLLVPIFTQGFISTYSIFVEYTTDVEHYPNLIAGRRWGAGLNKHHIQLNQLLYGVGFTSWCDFQYLQPYSSPEQSRLYVFYVELARVLKGTKAGKDTAKGPDSQMTPIADFWMELTNAWWSGEITGSEVLSRVRSGPV